MILAISKKQKGQNMLSYVKMTICDACHKWKDPPDIKSKTVGMKRYNICLKCQTTKSGYQLACDIEKMKRKDAEDLN